MIHRERLTATIDGDFVVFLIGMRLNQPWKVHKWWPVAAAMPRMISELRRICWRGRRSISPSVLMERSASGMKPSP
jgi:hypothetical protein